MHTFVGDFYAKPNLKAVYSLASSVAWVARVRAGLLA